MNKAFELCLIALSGDCARGGIGEANEVLPFKQEHYGIVKEYLEAQLAFSLHRLHPLGLDYASPEAQALYHRQIDAGMALREAGIFHHKYHNRTTWELAYMDELDDIQRYKPYVVVYPEVQVQDETVDKPYCTIADAKAWFGERGMFLSTNNIKVRGRWALVKEEWSIKDNEVDCYDLSTGSIYAEPWSDIKYTDSPFIPRNEEATMKAIAKMEEEE